MPLAFWRRTVRPARGTGPHRDDSTDVGEPSAAVRVRARRRLIGAAVLLLSVVIVIPLVLEPAPRPSLDTIAIDIPSEKTPFTPRLALPPVPSPDPPAPAPDLGAVPTAAEEPPAKGVDEKADDKARPPPAGKDTRSSGGSRFVVQAAAPASETAAREFAERLKKSGLASYTEKVETKQGARYRVRLGPYASRDEADEVRTRLKAQGISADLVTL